MLGTRGRVSSMDELTTASLNALGYDAHEIRAMVRRRELVRLRRGVYRRVPLDEADGPEHEALVRSVMAVGYEGAVVSHASAAALWGLPVPKTSLDRVHLTDPARRSGKRRAGLQLATAQVPEDDVVCLDGIPVTSVARTVLDLGRSGHPGWALAAADDALRRQVVGRDELEASAERLRGVRGIPAARRVVALADERSASVGESLSRHLFIEAGLVPDELQKQLRYEGCLDIVDFWWAPNLAGEFDGRLKYGLANPAGKAVEDVLWDEKQREDRLRRQGILFVRWTWDDLVRRPRDVVGRVRFAMRTPVAA